VGRDYEARHRSGTRDHLPHLVGDLLSRADEPGVPAQHVALWLASTRRVSLRVAHGVCALPLHEAALGSRNTEVDEVSAGDDVVEVVP